MPKTTVKNRMDERANSTSDCPSWFRRQRWMYLVSAYCARCVALRVIVIDCMKLGRPPAMTVVKVLVVVTVTVTTRCPPPGQLVATGALQMFGEGAVAENTPASVAHWQSLEAKAVTPGVLVAATAFASIPA